jgi:glycosyltransferase involved in cell wall biosynthesis
MQHVLVNGLSIGSGGGYTVGRELLRHLAWARPAVRFTLAVIDGSPIHAAFRDESFPANCALLWAPARALNRFSRWRYESVELPRYAATQHVDRVLQLNGMIVPSLRVPTLSHNQDPWPYRPEAWDARWDSVIAFLKRRGHARALRQAACAGWTSDYLRRLITGRLGVTPRCSEVFHNGLPDNWLTRASEPLSEWVSRPLELLSVSNVERYKRQDLVVRALPDLIARPGLESLVYRIAGRCDPAYATELRELAAGLGVGERVVLEGRVSDARAAELYSRAKCFVLMSVCESFGIPAIEAMSFGVPAVVSDCCAMPEVCGSAAALAPVDDVRALSATIARVLTDSSYAERLRADGARQVQKYSWRKTAERIADRLEAIAPRPSDR